MAEKAAWHDAYPKPRNEIVDTLTRAELLARFKKGQVPGSDFLLVDLRRQDHAVSLSLSQSLILTFD